ncbi:MAG: hypothetical protein KY053_01720 [Candidatus Liptonbacteria bacterium]|nr:hypothetical protein [Candidatus Liptonbacteria bacterium]
MNKPKKIETILILSGVFFTVILIIGSIFCINFTAASLVDALALTNIEKSEIVNFNFDEFKKLNLEE